jgi:Tol biopolymer transport system component
MTPSIHSFNRNSLLRVAALLLLLTAVCLGLGGLISARIETPVYASDTGANDATSCGAITFSGPTKINVTTPYYITSADFNKDGKSDLVVVRQGNSGVVFTVIFLGDGNGGFPTQHAYFMGGTLKVVSEDFNGDGKLDLASLNAGGFGGDVSVLLGNGDGTFDSFQPTLVSGLGSSVARTSITTGDFTSDGKADAVISAGDGKLYLLPGKGDGTFDAPITTTPSSYMLFIVARDFNGDGKLDLAGVSSEASVLLGDGTGHFGAATIFSVGSGSSDLLSDDFNGDGKPDLATANNFSNTVSILLGDGTGAFTTLNQSTTAGQEPISISSADINGDGKKDVAVLNRTSGNVVVLKGDGSGGLQAVSSYYVGRNPNSVTAGDLNGAGDIYLAAAVRVDNKLSILLHDCETPPAKVGFLLNESPFLFYPVTEGDNVSAVATVGRNGDITGAATVQYATSDESATAPNDYVPTSGSLQFAPGEVFKTITVPILNDSVSEDIEVANLTLSSPTGALELGPKSVLPIRITDNDSPPYVSINDIYITEGNSGGVLAIVSIGLSNPSSSLISVDYATADGSASAGSDYIAASGTVFFLPGQTSKNIGVVINGDMSQEMNEQFFVNLSNNSRLSKSQGVVTIRNDDGNTQPGSKSTRIAFISNAEIYLMNPDGSNPLRLTNNSANDGSPVWSPDGTKIAFSSNREAGYLDIYVMNADGSNQRRLFSDGNNNTPASWSPDGTKLLFVKQNLSGSSRELYVMNSDGSNPVRITNNTLTEASAAWSPDGSKIAFVDISVGASAGIYVINANGNGLTKLLAGTASAYPSSLLWSQDGTKIIYNWWENSSPQLYVMNADGSNPTKLGSGAGGDYLTMSPDGKKLAFFRDNDIFTVNADGSGLAQITNSSAVDTSPAWQPFPADVLQPSMVSLIKPSYTIKEDADNTPQHFASLTVDVVRGGDTSAAATVRYYTSDATSGEECDNFRGFASNRCDYTTQVGILRFAAGETAKTISIPVVNDGYKEGDEVFSLIIDNPVGTSIGQIALTQIKIQDDDADATPTTGTNNPYLSNSFFVRMNYLDFLGREPDTNGFTDWTNVLNNCGAEKGFLGAPFGCDRAHVSHGFFGSPEFTDRGYRLYRLYLVGTGVLPRYNNFVFDMAQLSGFGLSDAVQQQNLQNYLQGLTTRPEFIARFGDSLQPSQAALLVQKMEQAAGVTLPATATTNPGQPTQYGRQQLIDLRASGAFTVGQTLNAFVEQQACYDAFFNSGEVTMMYFAYLKRDPDLNDPNLLGWKEWLFVFTNGGAQRGRPDIPPRDIHHLVFGFIYSEEYRKRFGAP